MIFSADTWQVTLFSIAVGLAGKLLILPFDITLAWLFARKEWPLKSLFETIVLLPLVMPPVSTGLILLKIFGRRSPLGQWLYQMGFEIVFNWKGVLIAMQNAAGLQALIANQVQFSGSGSSALVAISKGNAPLKTVLAFNDQVLQWLVARPYIKSLRDLNGKKVATTGVASIAAYMLRNILTQKNIPKDIVLIDPGPVNRLPSLLSGAVDAAIVSPEERYAALDQGMPITIRALPAASAAKYRRRTDCSSRLF